MAQEAKLQSSVIGCGGISHLQESATNHWLSCTIGQAVVSGRSEREGVDRYEGFWVPWPSSIVSVDDLEFAAPLQAYPNPFAVSTKIEIDQSFASNVEVTLHTITGTRVRTVRLDVTPGVLQTVELASVDDNNVPLASGQYTCTVTGRTLSGANIRAYTTVTILK